jgi:hypothetical protein
MSDESIKFVSVANTMFKRANFSFDIPRVDRRKTKLELQVFNRKSSGRIGDGMHIVGLNLLHIVQFRFLPCIGCHSMHDTGEKIPFPEHLTQKGLESLHAKARHAQFLYLDALLIVGDMW